MGPKVTIFAVNTVLLMLILVCSQANAKPFFNPFNFAISTDFKEDGNVVSLTYPKNAQTISFKFDSKQISENKFDFAGLISAIVRKITSKFRNFNPFKLSAGTTSTTTPDPNFDFSSEDTGDIANGDDIFKSSTSESSIIASTDDASIEESSSEKDGGYESSGYILQKPNTSQKTLELDYLPPKITAPTSIYLPQN